MLKQIKEMENHILKTCRMVWAIALILVVLFTVYAQMFFIEGPEQAVDSFAKNLIFALGIGLFLIASMGVGYFVVRLGDQVLNEKLSFVKGLQRLALSHILRYSLLEAVAINGLVLAVFQQDISAAYPFLVLSVLGFFRYFPNYRNLFSQYPELTEPPGEVSTSEA